MPSSRSEFKNSTKVHANVFLDNKNSKVTAPGKSMSSTPSTSSVLTFHTVMAHEYAEIAKSGMSSSSSTFKNKKADWDAEAARPRAPAQGTLMSASGAVPNLTSSAATARATWSEVAQAQPTPKDELVSDLRAKGVKVTVADEPSPIINKAAYWQYHDVIPRWADPDCQEYHPERAKA